MWRVIFGEAYGGVLLLIYLILLFIPIFLVLSNLSLSISISNIIFYLLIVLNFPLSLYLTSKIMDYMDIHNWFE